ncbi:MAG TPA: helicase IV [Stenotrophomonas sp.]|nr:helicase IV [Stenotrophomonas sp.]
MTYEWAPSDWGQRLTRSPQWRLRLEDDGLVLTVDGHRHYAPLEALQVHPRLPWARLTLQRDGHAPLILGGLSVASARLLASALAARSGEQRQRDHVALFQQSHTAIQRWLAQVQAATDLADEESLWLTHEQQQALLQARPTLPLDEDALWTVFDDADLRSQLDGDPAAIEEALMLWLADWPTMWARRNEAHQARERVASRALLDRVESRPLTDEQARAVICFDNRVQVVAAAGSGKTSTMVAKAAYAIERGLVAPERIVMLAFNKDAATELQARADRAFQRLGLDQVRVEARTFHALGRQIIAQATGQMPQVPDWAVDATQGFHRLAEIIDQLKDRSLHFRTQWDMFRLVFGRDLPVIGGSLDAEEWDKDGQGYVRTLQGERVRSIEECVIADWLFYNGVAYTYTRRDAFDAGTDAYRQYRSDFYYPGIALYHDHLTPEGHDRAPAPRRGEPGARDGIARIETTSLQLRTGELFVRLGEALSHRGIELDPNPDRELPEGGAAPMPDSDLIGLVRTFISHAKSNALHVEDMVERLRRLPDDHFKHRYRLFLELIIPILDGWDDALVAEGGIDFEDMLNQAAEHLELGRYVAPFDLVMADEFQDASRARARLCRALVQAPGKHLFAVGDDWQSINRFAGADVSVMTGFVDWFGQGQVLKLEQTFRCPQALCDVSSAFVSRNPAQIPKEVHSVTPAYGAVLQAFQVASRDRLAGAVEQYLERLHQQLLSGQVPPGRDGKVTVFVLGRYNADRVMLPATWRARHGQHMDVSFLTTHRAKGAEADYVILPGMLDRRFPNTRADDPVLSLAMPDSDAYPLGEERRLFYVALTRARRSVAMFTVQGRRSAFLTELVNEGAVRVTSMAGEAIHEQACPACKVGVIVPRTGPYGAFQSCSGYPRCEYKPPKVGGQPGVRTFAGA